MFLVMCYYFRWYIFFSSVILIRLRAVARHLRTLSSLISRMSTTKIEKKSGNEDKDEEYSEDKGKGKGDKTSLLAYSYPTSFVSISTFGANPNFKCYRIL